MVNRRQCANHLLMIKPVNFFFNTETALSNVFQNRPELSDIEIKNRVTSNFNKTIDILKKERIDIDVIDPVLMKDLPDQVFPNNWFQVTHEGKLILFPMYSKNRRKERLQYIIDHIQRKYKINEVIDLTFYEKSNLYLEGTGSVVLDHPSMKAYAVESVRTSKEVFDEYCKVIGYKGILFNANDVNGMPIYHTNVLMSIGPGFSVVCLDLIAESDRKRVYDSIVDTQLELINIDFSQIERFCGNILTVLGDSEEYIIVMSERACKAFSENELNIISKYARVICVPVDSIENIGGGGIRCMLAEMFSLPI